MATSGRVAENPFRIGGVVSGPFFADREDERRRIRKALVTPQEHVLVYGPRRMGKTSMLRVVQESLRHAGHHVILADLSTASSLNDMTTRLLQAATRELGRKWRDVAAAFAERLRIKLTLEPDPATKELTVTSLHPGVRREQIVEATAWPVRFAPDAATTEPPSADVLAVLRELQARTRRAHGEAA